MLPNSLLYICGFFWPVVAYFLQLINHKHNHNQCRRVLNVTIFCNPRIDKLWVLARLKSPPTMNRLLERRWDVEVIKVSKRSYVGVGDIRGDVHICNNNMIEFR